MQRKLNELLCVLGFPRFNNSVFNSLNPNDGFSKLNRSLEGGEKDIVDLVSNSNHEGVWVYSNSDSIWYNIGGEKGEIVRTNDRELELSVSCPVFNLGKLGEKVSHYHFHPNYSRDNDMKAIEEQIISPLISDLSLEQVDLLRNAYFQACEVQSSLPSVGDIQAYFVYREKSKGCDITFKIGSCLGITTVKLGKESNLDEVLSRYSNFGSTEDMPRLYEDKNLSPLENALKFLDSSLGDSMKISVDER